jgi:hypothetical protein
MPDTPPAGAHPPPNPPTPLPIGGSSQRDRRASPGPFPQPLLGRQSTARLGLARGAPGRSPPRCLSEKEFPDVVRRGEASSDLESGSTARRMRPHRDRVAVGFRQARRAPGLAVGSPSAAPARSKGSHQRSIGGHPPTCRHRPRRHWWTSPPSPGAEARWRHADRQVRAGPRPLCHWCRAGLGAPAHRHPADPGARSADRSRHAWGHPAEVSRPAALGSRSRACPRHLQARHCCAALAVAAHPIPRLWEGNQSLGRGRRTPSRIRSAQGFGTPPHFPRRWERGRRPTRS